MWQPPISEKQAEIINSPARFNLVTGPRKASKSWGCLHDICWHMWGTSNSVGMMLGETTTQNSDAGLWPLLTETIVPMWVEADFGFEWDTEPRMDPATHKLHFKIKNKFGNTSKMYLESLESETHIEKFKNKIYDYIYGTEFSNFKQRKTFDILKSCFRGRPLTECKMVLDTNPPEEGEDSWMYRLFWWFRTVDLDNLTDDLMAELGLKTLDSEKLPRMVAALKQLQSGLAVHSFIVDDNCFISQEEKDGVYADHAHDPDLLARYYYGKWVRASGDGIFHEVWRPQIHVIGEAPVPSDPEPEMMLPEENCIELGTGNDIGSRRNTAIAFIEPIQMEIEEKTREGTMLVVKPAFKILDEYVSLGQQQKMSIIAEEVMDRVTFWESHCKIQPRWRHFSDNSAFSMDLISESDEAKELYRLTKGTVELESITDRIRHRGAGGIKGHGAVEKRISMMERILFENRIFVNAAKCPNTMEMFSSMKRGNNGKLSATSIFKHVFDAISYFVAVKCWDEMIRTPRIPTNKEEQRGILVTRV